MRGLPDSCSGTIPNIRCYLIASLWKGECIRHGKSVVICKRLYLSQTCIWWGLMLNNSRPTKLTNLEGVSCKHPWVFLDIETRALHHPCPLQCITAGRKSRCSPSPWKIARTRLLCERPTPLSRWWSAHCPLNTDLKGATAPPCSLSRHARPARANDSSRCHKPSSTLIKPFLMSIFPVKSPVHPTEWKTCFNLTTCAYAARAWVCKDNPHGRKHQRTR